jgi:DNA-directed RNA polymerase specialized sigma24 family protein
MNSIIHDPSVPSSTSPAPSTPVREISLGDLASRPANDRTLTRPIRRDDPFTRAYVRFATHVRAAAKNYVPKSDVEDLVQDVFLVASQHPSKLAPLDRGTLSWLIGVAKRCATDYSSRVGFVPLDDLLEREKGDDREGDDPYEEIPW